MKAQRLVCACRWVNNESRAVSEPYFIYLSCVRSLVYYLRQHNVPVDGVLKVMGVAKADLSDLDRMLPATTLPAALAAGESLSRDANIGLHLGLSMAPRDIGIVGKLVMTCTNSAEVLNLHARFESLVGNCFRPEYRVSGEDTTLVLHCRDVALQTRQTNELRVFGWLALVHWLIRKDFTLTQVDFAHSRPAKMTEQERHLRCPLNFNCTETRVHFPTRLMAEPMPHAASHLRHEMELEARSDLQSMAGDVTDASPVLAEAKRFISQEIGHGVPDFGRVADAVAMSPQRLQTLLEATDTNFDLLVDALRKQLAERYLHQKPVTLLDAALLLGFSEQSEFQASVKRWFDATPSQYRRMSLR